MLQNQVSFSSDFFERLENASHLPASFWDEFRPRTNLRDGVTAPDVVISESKLLVLADALSLSPEKLLEGKIDFRALEAHSQGNVNYVPEKYVNGAFSRIRTSAHLFDAAEQLFGWKGRSSLMRKQQISEATLAELTNRISLNFLSDVCAELENMGVSHRGFVKIGEQSVMRNYHSEVGLHFRNSRNMDELMERCFNELIKKYYEQNYDYSLLKLADSVAVVEARPRKEVCDALNEPRIGSRLVCIHKAGVFACLPGYKHLPFAKVTETECIHLGDEACRFVIDYTAATQAESRKLPFIANQ